MAPRRAGGRRRWRGGGGGGGPGAAAAIEAQVLWASLAAALATSLVAAAAACFVAAVVLFRTALAAFPAMESSAARISARTSCCTMRLSASSWAVGTGAGALLLLLLLLAAFSGRPKPKPRGWAMACSSWYALRALASTFGRPRLSPSSAVLRSRAARRARRMYCMAGPMRAGVAGVGAVEAAPVVSREDGKGVSGRGVSGRGVSGGGGGAPAPDVKEALLGACRLWQRLPIPLVKSMGSVTRASSIPAWGSVVELGAPAVAGGDEDEEEEGEEEASGSHSPSGARRPRAALSLSLSLSPPLTSSMGSGSGACADGGDSIVEEREGRRNCRGVRCVEAVT